MPDRLIRGFLGITVATVALAACGTDTEQSGNATFTGADAVASDVSDLSRIVSLSGDLTEFVYALGHGAAIVGVDVTTVYPEEALGVPIVGVGRFITAEGVLSVDPTLVLADEQSGPTAAIDQIRAAGVPVVVLPVAATFAGLYDKIASLGVLLGADEEAVALVDSIAEDLETAIGPVDATQTPRVAYLYTRGPDVALLFGDGMVSHPVIEAAGGVDAGAASGIEGSIQATAEAIVAAAPDVIVVPEEGFSILGGLDELLGVPGVAQTPAAVNGRIFAYPEGDFLTFGPRITDSVRRLVADLYP